MAEFDTTEARRLATSMKPRATATLLAGRTLAACDTIDALRATVAELRATNAAQTERMARTFEPGLVPTLAALDRERGRQDATIAALDQARPR